MSFEAQSRDTAHLCNFTMAAITQYTSLLEEELTCSICSDIFEDPRTLQCFHKFCFHCIKDWIKRCDENKQVASCPICKEKIFIPEEDVSKLRCSFYLNSLLKLLSVMKSSNIETKDDELPTCVSCDKKSKLLAFCPQCAGLICSECVNIHSTLKAFKDEHQLAMFKDFKKDHLNSYIKNQAHCQERFHDKNKLEYYCQSCNKCICQKCAATKHSTHNKTSVEEAAEQAKQSINGDINRVKKVKDKYFKELELSKQNMAKYGKEIEAAIKQVRESTLEYTKMIQSHEVLMIATLNSLWFDQKEVHDLEQEEIQACIASLSDFEFHGQALQDQNVAQLILQSQQDLPQRCEELLAKPSILSRRPASRNVEYIPKPDVMQYLQNLGKIEESVIDPSRCSIESLNDVICGSVNEFHIVTRNPEGKMCSTNLSMLDVRVKDDDDKEVERKVIENDSAGRYTVTYKAVKPSSYHVSVCIGGQAISNSPMAAKTIDPKVDLKPVKVFGGEGLGNGELKGPCAMALSNAGEVAISDYTIHRVVIFSIEGEFLRDFGREGVTDGELCGPCGVVFNEDRSSNQSRILVSDNPLSSGRIQEFDTKGKYLRTMYEEKRIVMLTMCISDETIAVCCQGDKEIRSCIKLFSKETGQFVQEIASSDKHKLMPFHVAYGNDQYFVTYIDYHYVHVFDKKGEFRHKFGDKGKREGKSITNCVTGLAVYGPDMILVCDSFNHRLQLFTQSGRLLQSFGHRGTGTGEMNGPVDVVVTPNGKVLVLEYHGNRIQIWQ